MATDIGILYGMTSTIVKSFYSAIKYSYLLLIFFVLIFALPQISEIPHSFSINATNSTSFQNSSIRPGDMNKSFAQAGAQYTTCPSFIGIAPEEGQSNLTETKRIEKMLENCQRFDASLGYVVGSLKVSIKGISDNDCHLP